MDNHETPLRAIENVRQSSSDDISPEEILQYTRYMKNARDAAEAGHPKKALELLNKAAAIQKTEKVLKRIQKIEAFLAANSDSEDEDNGLVHLGKGYHLMKDVHDKLYSYQRECLLWFWRLHRKNKGGILGDDMGLGKTIQVVAFLTGLFDMQQVNSVLIVLPVAVIINWEKEFEKWSPGINVQCFHGSSKRDKERALARVQRRGGVLLTSYGLVLTSFKQMVQHDGYEFIWDYIILDEGHKIKNPGKTTKAVHTIPAKRRFILTGTPIQNNLKEMWALFDFVTHGSVLGTIKTFMMEYGNPITRARERDATSSEKLLGNEMSESLRKLIDPYFLRRTKADVLENKENQASRDSSGFETDGPGSKEVSIPRLTRKNDFIVWLYLTETQIQIYKDFTQLDQVKELLMTQRSPLAELTVLKKLCDHPRLLSARACQQLGLQTAEDIESFSDSDDQVKDTGAAACNIQQIDDEILMAESGKIQFLLELLYNLREQGHRTLVFSQSRKMLDILEKILQNRNFKLMRLDGTVSKLSDREQRIKCFQNNKSYTVFLLTTQVGGVGLTLTGADRVVIIDPSWNPATDAQAVDRAYRIGQTRSVVIYRLITCGTVEEKIYRRQIFKDSITKQATGASKNPYRYFSRQDLKELFILDDPKRSTTQEQLEEMHSAHRKSDTELDSHIAFLHSLDTLYGLSDHDLMFSQEAIREENQGFETETDDYIQRRVQRAQELVSAESDLTTQLKEQLESNTQAPGIHPHISEINADRDRLKKTWKQVHGSPDHKEILRPGADYEERYVSKKRPEPEYDLTNESSDVILDRSGEDAEIESISPKSSISSTSDSHHQGNSPHLTSEDNRGNTSDQNVSSIVIEDSDDEKEDVNGIEVLGDSVNISSSYLPPFEDGMNREAVREAEINTAGGTQGDAVNCSSSLPTFGEGSNERQGIEMDTDGNAAAEPLGDMEDEDDISSASLPMPFGEDERVAADRSIGDANHGDDSRGNNFETSLLQGADMNIQCDLGNDTLDESQEENSEELSGDVHGNGIANLSVSPGKLSGENNLQYRSKDSKHASPEHRSGDGRLASPRDFGKAEAATGNLADGSPSNDEHEISYESNTTEEEPMAEAADFEIQCELGTTVFEDTDDEAESSVEPIQLQPEDHPAKGERDVLTEGGGNAREDLDESVNMMRDLSLARETEEEQHNWEVSTSTPSKLGATAGQRHKSFTEEKDSLLLSNQKSRKLVDDSDDDIGRSGGSRVVIESDDEGEMSGPIRDESQASMIAESDCDVSAIQESFQEIMDLDDTADDLGLQRRSGEPPRKASNSQLGNVPDHLDASMGEPSPGRSKFKGSFPDAQQPKGNNSLLRKCLDEGCKEGSPETFFEARDFLKTPSEGLGRADRKSFETPRESFGTPRLSWTGDDGLSKMSSGGEIKGRSSLVDGRHGEDMSSRGACGSGDDFGRNRHVPEDHINEEDISMVSTGGDDASDEDGRRHSHESDNHSDGIENAEVKREPRKWSDQGQNEVDVCENGYGSVGRNLGRDSNDVINEAIDHRGYGSAEQEPRSGISGPVHDSHAKGGGQDTTREGNEQRGYEDANPSSEQSRDYDDIDDGEMEEGDEYACSEDLDEEIQEKYYQFLDKGEQYLELGRKTKALKYFLMALNVDNTSHALQLRTYTLAQEREKMKN